MPSSAKRQAKGRRGSRSEQRRDYPDTPSPTHTSKRRRKTQEAPAILDDTEEHDSSHLTDQPNTNAHEIDQLVSLVTQHLLAPKEAVQASKDHANSIHETNKDGVKAYAKIAAQDWTYYVTQLSINIGRSSEPAPATSRTHAEDEGHVHIDLGPSKMVSRQHALISFDPKEEQWFLEVNGRNGVKVNDVLFRQGQRKPLVSGEILEIAGSEMMFVLPSEISPLDVHPIYHKRAGLPTPSQDVSSPWVSPNTIPALAKPQPIAPVPPEHMQPGTPTSARKKPNAGPGKTPQRGNPLPVAGGEVDLGDDCNRHIKPQYSYAQMITQAITQAPDEKLNLNGIYNFITQNYAYYRHQQPAGWQNSIRHNLSLNKAFDKVARSSDEPGKGMKWQIVPEAKQEMIRSAYKGGRGGHRGSSAPSSPSQLNYITQGPKDMAAREPGSARKRKASPFPRSPPPSSLRYSSKETPDERTASNVRNSADDANNSPPPRTAKHASGLLQPQSPILTPSYLQEETGSFATPAPLRVHPKLAPPSTAQRPSQHMPTSSPAPFWKYADIGSTPLKPLVPFDPSPSKRKSDHVRSSSPAPLRGDSPSRSPTSSRLPGAKEIISAVDEDDGQAFDLSKGFQSIGSYHAPVSEGLSISSAASRHLWQT